jgi:hypothetical protein
MPRKENRCFSAIRGKLKSSRERREKECIQTQWRTTVPGAFITAELPQNYMGHSNERTT